MTLEAPPRQQIDTLKDRLGRSLRSLRVSVIDRCNLRCNYCMPEEEYVWLPHRDILTFAEIGRRRGQDPHDAVLNIIIEEEARPWMLAEDVSEEDFLNIARHPAGGVISDGFSLAPEGTLAEGKHHPRSYGAFPYFLRRFVRDQGTMSWEAAIHKLTAHAAARFRIGERGLLREGYWADLLIFDPDLIGERADFNDPYRYSQGIDFVVVNGKIAVEKGEVADGRAGQVLRG